MTTNFPRGVRTVTAILALACASGGPILALRAQDRPGSPGNEQAPGDASGKQERKKELDEMRRRAEGTKITLRDNADKTPAKLVPEPIMRYSDQYIRAIDATMWAYGSKGRPVAIQKVECYSRPDAPKYLYALFSLSDGLIEAQWPGESGWSSTKPGVEMRVLPRGPKAAPTEAARTLQIKEVIRRFAVTMTGWAEAREEMRLLPRPIHRYGDPDAGLQDGAIFAFAANGTNPNFLMLIELRGADLTHATWNYGGVRATDGKLSVRLDGKEVWSAPWHGGMGGRYDTWLYFYASQQQPGQ